MTDDAHAQANADQVLLLREALAVDLPLPSEDALPEESAPADVPLPAPEAAP
ncbi:hypothetical protein L1280_002861 [Deinococcus sp. HSC-46F16]|uniref:hypothetical protein n=1 Tax=Deinococcus sp. HSC-46F16 TaxID=2910968 RepID=UPI0020A07892|nr:hypothetical protein [Deinococcus sp. HSC-46F16]MCP2015685.1 hypothetical protein [Deinococcus sp. HSC-46F16]